MCRCNRRILPRPVKFSFFIFFIFCFFLMSSFWDGSRVLKLKYSKRLVAAYVIEDTVYVGCSNPLNVGYLHSTYFFLFSGCFFICSDYFLFYSTRLPFLSVSSSFLVFPLSYGLFFFFGEHSTVLAPKKLYCYATIFHLFVNSSSIIKTSTDWQLVFNLSWFFGQDFFLSNNESFFCRIL